MFKRILRSGSLIKRARWILAGLAVVLILPMVLFFSGSRSQADGPNGTAGVIFGRKVSWDTYQQQYDLVHRAMEANFGGEALPPQFAPFVQEQTWDRLILVEAARRRVEVSAEELVREIQTITAFHENGRFSRDLYHRYLRATGTAPQRFEDQLRKDLQIRKLIEQLNAEVTVTDEDVRQAYAEQHVRLRGAVIAVDTADVAAQLRERLTEDQLRSYYDERPDLSAIPTRRTIDYVGMSRAEAIAAQPEPSANEIQRYYDEHQAEFTREDKTVRPLDEARDDVRQALREQAAEKALTTLSLDLQEDVEQGLRLEEISTTRNRPIQRVGPGDRETMAVPGGPTHAMLQSAFDATLGELTAVHHTPAGTYVLRPFDEVSMSRRSFDEMRGTLEPLLAEQLGREASLARARQLHDEAVMLISGGKTIDEAAAASGVEAKRPEPFSRATPGPLLSADDGSLAALFALQPGQTSEVVVTGTGAAFVHVENRLPFDPAQFERDNDAFRDQLLKTRQEKHLQETIERLRADAQLKSYVPKPLPLP